MKKYVLFSLSGLLFIVLVSTRSMTHDDPQDPKKVSHIKIVTIKDGKKTEIDTIITGKDVKVFSNTGGKGFNWVTIEDEKNLDSLKKVIEFDGKDGQEKKIIIMKHAGEKDPMIIRKLGSGGDGSKTMSVHVERAGRGERRHEIIREIETEGDSGKTVTVTVEEVDPGKEDILMFNDRPGRGRRMIMEPFAPGVPAMPNAPAFRYRQGQRGNVINLSDPGVLSFKKKKMSGGREKITIIRNEVKEDMETFNVKVGAEGDEIQELNAPRVVRGIDIRKHPVGKNVEVEIIKKPVKK